jgi:hypothetical protein
MVRRRRLGSKRQTQSTGVSFLCHSEVSHGAEDHTVGAGYESFYQKNADAEAYRQFAKSVGIDDETLTAYIHGTMT